MRTVNSQPVMAMPSSVFPVICVIFFCLLHVGNPEVFSAIVDLERVLHSENDIANSIREYVATEEKRLGQLREVANDYERHSREALVDVGSHLANPLNAFLLVKRFTSDWEEIQALIRNNTGEKFLESLSQSVESFPDGDDLTGAVTALLRLQDTYALPTEKIARGELQGVKKSPALTAGDCFELGRLSYNNGDYYHTILWIDQALEVWEDEVNKTADKIMLLDYLAYSSYVQGNVKKAYNLTLEWLRLEPDHTRAQNNKRYFEQILAEAESQKKKGDEGVEQEFKNERVLSDYRASEEFQTYERLCRGEQTHVYKRAHQLTCQYKRHHPQFYIRPLKEETIYFKPWIVIYHEMMTDKEIAKVKELASPRLKRATVQNPQTGVLETAYYRVSKSAWLHDWEDPLVAQVSGRVRAMSNLTLETAEELQVVNYGIGGHYEPHFDFAREREKQTFENWRGNRIATFICYMSDVEAGGATVFPYIGVKLWPTKGSCAFWYNLLQSGEGDYDTRHAACPVLTGSKWVCNKWIHERGQEFMRPCALSPET